MGCSLTYFKNKTMKKIKNTIILVLLSVFVFSGCEKELDTEGISRTTYYPVITVKGEQWNSVLIGEVFTDPGAEASEDGQRIELSVNGTVNTNIPGVYTITYSATNKDGFSVIKRRYVGVIDPAVADADMSGKYKRNAGANGVSTVNKLGVGHYVTDNVGGTSAAGSSTTVHFYHYEGNKLGVPAQDVNGSEFAATKATVDLGQSYSWEVLNSGYGAGIRTFVKF
ncbi:immunoglobulin-like domain-containing protein [Pontibacter sp. MBLB2868]|uniref:immunoglobulin-like domain-containing protein n=1 Tax=Pontibacter sp. MBLB2868 TaxID=3451555 RepID=UPI003F7536E3